MSTKKVAIAQVAKTGTRSKNELEVLKLESNVPFPERGFRDPAFIEKADELLKTMRVTQSFVIPKNKFHAFKKLVKIKHGAYVIKSTVIKPDNKFVRIWRTK